MKELLFLILCAFCMYGLFQLTRRSQERADQKATIEADPRSARTHAIRKSSRNKSNLIIFLIAALAATLFVVCLPRKKEVIHQIQEHD